MDRPVRFFLSLCALALVAATAAPELTAASRQSPEIALQAKEMLSPNRWVQAIQIDNTNRQSRYPGTVYAAVFELNGSLWFYTATGTQELRRSRNRTHEYKDNLMPLLKRVDRGFVSYTTLSAEPDQREASFPKLVNGCVIESIYTFETKAQAEQPMLKANILLYSSTRNSRRGQNGNATGHAVLVYETPNGVFFVDPPELDIVGNLSEDAEWDPVAIAAEIEEPYGKVRIDDAFFVPFPVQRLNVAGTGM